MTTRAVDAHRGLLPVAIGASVTIIRSSWSEEGARVSLPLWAHAACFLAAFLELLTRSIKIRLSAASLSIPLDVRTSLRVALGGDFGASITPARSGAEPARFLILREAGLPIAETIVVLFLELFLELLSLAALAVVLAIVLRGSSIEERGLAGMVTAYATFVIGVGAIGYIVARRWIDRPVPSAMRRVGMSDHRWRTMQRWLRHLRENVTMMRAARWWGPDRAGVSRGAQRPHSGPGARGGTPLVARVHVLHPAHCRGDRRRRNRIAVAPARRSRGHGNGMRGPA